MKTRINMKTKLTCPLGHVCERVVDDHIEKCIWHVKIYGKNPTSEEIIDNWGCAIAWMPILSVEMSQTNRGQTQAIESMRNEAVKAHRQNLSRAQAVDLDLALAFEVEKEVRKGIKESV